MKVRCFPGLGFVMLANLLALPSQAAETRALVVSGLGGEPLYEQQFRELSERVAREFDQVMPHVVLLHGEMASQAQIRTTFEAFAERSGPRDSLVFVFVGHGSFDGKAFRFNVPGRDFDARALQGWLEAVPARERVVIVTGSASGALHEAFDGSAVALFTATRSGNEKNATEFPDHFVDALGAEAADVDKDRLVSVEEAFMYTESAVGRHFEQTSQLASEHARRSGPETALVLAKVESDPPAPGTRMRLPKDRDDPALERRAEIEAQIETLRTEKSRLGPAEYFSQLQELLLELAMVEQQIEDGKVGFDDIFAEQPEDTSE